MFKPSVMDHIKKRKQLPSNQSIIGMKSYQETAYLLYKEDSVSALQRINSETFLEKEGEVEEQEKELMNLNSSYRFQKFSNKFL